MRNASILALKTNYEFPFFAPSIYFLELLLLWNAPTTHIMLELFWICRHNQFIKSMLQFLPKKVVINSIFAWSISLPLKSGQKWLFGIFNQNSYYVQNRVNGSSVRARGLLWLCACFNKKAASPGDFCFVFGKDIVLTKYFLFSLNNVDSLIAVDSLRGIFRTLSINLTWSFLHK